MFEAMIADLNKELDGLRARREKCWELMQRIQDKDKRAKLSASYDIIGRGMDRAALCLDILGYRVSVEISEDFSTVRFPIAKPKKQTPSQERLAL